VTGWPRPGDTELSIARTVAVAYRNHLHTANPQVCDRLDLVMRDYGQTWVFPRPAEYEDTDAVTTAVAAELVSRSPSVVRRWAVTEYPPGSGGMLLPRFGWDGPSRTYLVGDVRRAAHISDTRTTYRPG
jgi:hypothetical protein